MYLGKLTIWIATLTTSNEGTRNDRPISTYDVAIVGYGPVGVTAADLLGQWA